MLDVTLDLITQTASSSLFAFCFCNLIIVVILVGSKPGFELGREEKKKSPLLEASISTNTVDDDHDQENISNSKGFCEEMGDSQVANQVENEEKLLAEEEKCLSEDEKIGEDDDDDDDDDDDELRKRVEEFIQKVNRGWKAELLRNSHLLEA